VSTPARADYTHQLPVCPDCGTILDDAPRTRDHNIECPVCRRVHHPTEVYA